jgi:hypothetical protein
MEQSEQDLNTLNVTYRQGNQLKHDQTRYGTKEEVSCFSLKN